MYILGFWIFQNSVILYDILFLRIVNFWEVVTMGKKSTNNNIIDVDVEPVLPTPDSPCIIMYTTGTLYQTHPVSLCTPQVHFTIDSPCMYTSGKLYQTHPALLCTPQVYFTILNLYCYVHLRYNTPDSPCIILYTSGGGAIHQTHPCIPPIHYILSILTQVQSQRTIVQFSSLRNISMWPMLSVLLRIIKDIRINQHIVYHDIQYASCKHYIWEEIFKSKL